MKTSGGRLRPLVAVLGPTGSGKSQIAFALAKKFNGSIINADAMQMYKGLNIITNKPTPSELNACPHHLIDFLDPLYENYNVKMYKTYEGCSRPERYCVYKLDATGSKDLSTDVIPMAITIVADYLAVLSLVIIIQKQSLPLPETITLYQVNESIKLFFNKLKTGSQILPDQYANCQAMQALFKIIKIPYNVEYYKNAEEISPNG
ncbi:tRNA dimethylallyltransferase-like [Octopus sinensis]|uniref:tRNA dimethylallyltransferase-like n=1 Tax=Octopus sinensis TaxID=2607531 RepID=A0A6P7TU64_9MOLL|nr:tRNA dimethylallyltransferase-like [Octopus sinensis]